MRSCDAEAEANRGGVGEGHLGASGSDGRTQRPRAVLADWAARPEWHGWWGIEAAEHLCSSGRWRSKMWRGGQGFGVAAGWMGSAEPREVRGELRRRRGSNLGKRAERGGHGRESRPELRGAAGKAELTSGAALSDTERGNRHERTQARAG